jgi:hypothetical protein
MEKQPGENAKALLNKIEGWDCKDCRITLVRGAGQGKERIKNQEICGVMENEK